MNLLFVAQVSESRKGVARATRPPRSATRRPERGAAALPKRSLVQHEASPPFRPAGRRTEQAGRLCYLNSGFTLIELMVVVAIIGIMTAMMIPEMKGSFQDALLRSSSRELINVFDLAYSRAVGLNQTRLVLLDESTGRYEVEKQVMENGQENFVPADDMPGDKGQLDPRITVKFHQPEEPSADDNTPAKTPAPAPAAESGKASSDVTIAFYPDGTADAGEIMLRDRDGFRLLLQINPVTARVHVVEMERETAP